MKPITFALITATLALTASAQPPAAKQKAAPSIPNPQIDYRRFMKIAAAAESLRESHRLTEEQFIAAAAQPGTVVLDARSADKFALRHIKGSVNLPFTDFTVESLAKVIPAKTTKVLIYCNNNFTGSPAAFASKSAPAALNISTFVSLTTYEYTNIYELGPLKDVKNTKIVFEGAEVRN
ncbi:MAG TPA: rhodanese-like domain-containing protein [Verrucomicrobiales bacterium]|jgi:rhodanese-related sulfurtransferase|nr:rhodanese-like domain-containing protein [Verrucomicrobiales bacterium]